MSRRLFDIDPFYLVCSNYLYIFNVEFLLTYLKLNEKKS